MHLWCIFMQHVLHLHIWIWIDLPSQRASHTSFYRHENGSSAFNKHRLSVYFSLVQPDLCLCFTCGGWDCFLLFFLFFLKVCWIVDAYELKTFTKGSQSAVSAWSFYLVLIWNKIWCLFNIALFFWKDMLTVCQMSRSHSTIFIHMVTWTNAMRHQEC